MKYALVVTFAVIFPSLCLAQGSGQGDCTPTLDPSTPIGEILSCFKQKMDELTKVKATLAAYPTIPSGAIVAFAKECPADGWTRYKPATARFIVGAGEAFHPKHETWKRQRPNGGFEEVKLTPKVAESSDGEETHRLSIQEIPPHNHGGVWGGTSTKAGMLNDNAFHTSGYQQMRTEGGGQPHNNMPPYIALYYCVKN